MEGAIKYFPKKLLGHEIFSAYGVLGYKFFLEKFVEPSVPLSYILNSFMTEAVII